MARGKRKSPAEFVQIIQKNRMINQKQSEGTSWTKATGNGDHSSKITVSSERTERPTLFRTLTKPGKLSQSSSGGASDRSDRTQEYTT